MKRFIIFVLLSLLLITNVYSDKLIRIDRKDFPMLESAVKAADVTGVSIDYFDIHVTESELNVIRNYGIQYTEIELNASKADFLTMAQAYDYIDSLHQLYPSITDIDTIGTTYEGNPLVILKINGTDPQAWAGQDAFMLMAMHHAREWQTVNLALFFADSILSAYAADSVTEQLIDSVFIVVFPMVNPDGYDYSRTSDIWWRKNRTYRDGLYGVDVNRNYPGGCNGDPLTDWGFIANSVTSHYPSLDVYCGPYGASEPETRTVMALVDSYDFNITLSLHSSGEIVIWPWGSVYYTAPDSVLLESAGTEAANRMRKQDGSSPFDPGQSVGLYPSSGDSDDWIYGWSKYVKGRTTLAYTFEVDVSFNSATSLELDSLLRRVYPGMIYMAHKADSITGMAIEVPMKPELSFSNDTLNWALDNYAEARYYTVFNYSNPEAIYDSLNSDSLYNIRNFTKSSARYNSAGESYLSVSMNNNCSVLEPVYRLNVSAGDTLSFYTWYNLENNYDKAFVEISEDGKYYAQIDTVNGIFTGASSGWEHIRIPLSQYAGKEIYFRIRSVYDPGTLNEGIYIDDISPVITFGSDSVFADSVYDMFIEIPMTAYESELFAVMPHCDVDSSSIISDRILCSVSPVGEEEREAAGYSVYFSPETRILSISLPPETSFPVNVGIYNTAGYRIKNISESSEHRISVDMKDTPSGKYFVNIKGNQFNSSGFLIIH